MGLWALLVCALVQDVAGLIERLGDERLEEREAAYARLKALGPPAIPALREAAARPDPEIALRATRLLHVLEILEALDPKLREAYPGVEESLAAGDGKFVEKFLEATSRGYGANDRDLREELARLAVLGARTSAERLKIAEAAEHSLVGGEAIALLLKDKDPSVRRAATQALGEIGRNRKRRAQVLEPLREALKDVDARTRAEAVRAFALLKHAPAIPLLVERCEDRSDIVRREAAEALGQLRATEAVPRIAALLGDVDTYVRGAAIEALADLEASERAGEIAERLSDAERHVRGKAAEALGRLRIPEAADAIAALLGDSEREIWGRAARALGRLDARAAGPAIVKALKDADATTRREAAWAVGRLQTREALPSLLDLLDDPDLETRKEAVDALGNLGAAEAVEPLRRLLKDNRLAVPAASALCQLGVHDGVPVLIAAERTSAINALARPDEWKALGSARWTGPRRGTCAEILAELSKRLDRPIEGGPEEPGWAWSAEDRLTLRDVLLSLGREAILEAGRVRLVPRDEAAWTWRKAAAEGRLRTK